MTIEKRRADFRALHEKGCFVMPNPCDRGSAVALERMGFKALASSSAGFAFTRALPDSIDVLSRDMVLEHLRDLVEGTGVPINADYQNGYGDDAASLAKSVELCVEAGVAGLSIEDATGDDARPLYDLETAVERVRVARRAIDATRSGVLLTARAECFLVKHPEPREETLRRLRAYAAAGADVLYAPGPRDLDTLKAIVDAVAPKPVNVLVHSSELRVADLSAIGVRRISVGSSLARVAWTAFMNAARAIHDRGEFSAFDRQLSIRDIGALF